MTSTDPDGERTPTRRTILRALGATGLSITFGSGIAGSVPTGSDATDNEDPEYPSPEWYAREAENYARTQEAPSEQARDSAFLTRLAEQSTLNRYESERRSRREPGWDTDGNVCSERYYGPCAGDPFLYPEAEFEAPYGDSEVSREALDTAYAELQESVGATPPDQFDVGVEDPRHGTQFDDGATEDARANITNALESDHLVPTWSGHPFYDNVGEVEQVAFYTSGLDHFEGGARLNGHLWVPKHADPGEELPGVVITNGGAATEAMYWWAAVALVENGYMVMTFDPTAQGKSDNNGAGYAGWEQDAQFTDQVNAIDFFRSTPEDPYPHNAEHERPDDEAAGVIDYNPFWDRLDHDRIGASGHSLGAYSTTVAQGVEPWPDPSTSDDNPIKAVVAWDSLLPDREVAGRTAEPRVPAMSQRADYFVDGHVPTPKTEPPDPETNKAGFRAWRDAGVPCYEFTIRGSTHFEWSLGGGLPATSWEHWGNQMATHYTVAWYDYWLKERGEPGYDTAKDRLLERDPWQERLSFYYRSARFFPANRNAGNWPVRDPENPPGEWYYCEDLLDGDC